MTRDGRCRPLPPATLSSASSPPRPKGGSSSPTAAFCLVEEASLFLPWQGYAKARLWLEVAPDDYYDNQVYDVLLANLAPDSPSATLIARADRIAQASSYRLFVTEIEKP